MYLFVCLWQFLVSYKYTSLDGLDGVLVHRFALQICSVQVSIWVLQLYPKSFLR
jgi:hypothetical protein